MGDHMCAYDELGIDTDGTSQRRTLAVKDKRKAGGTRRWGRVACLCVCFFVFCFSLYVGCLFAAKKKKKNAQPTELVAKEGKTKAMRVTIGLITWRKAGLFTKSWVQHSGKKITWSHVHGLSGFPVGISANGESAIASSCSRFFA